MPVIWDKLKDPTDLVIQGESMRSNAMVSSVNAAWPMIDSTLSDLALDPVVVAGEQSWHPTTGTYPVPPKEILPNPFSGTLISANAVISTPCGALIPFAIGLRLFDTFTESTTRFALSGVTKDSTGAALGSCRVVVFETGRMNVGGAPVVSETTSDGSGNYSVQTATNSAHHAIAYKPGSPDVAGITVNTLTPAPI